ncbi:hypothetical protein TRICI_001934 [Trichomonascus ciferrii]|uniref:SUN domain-containing protein n=1 Tax=Trichomonascus ciferrii TaxID=44093 RepID=A0A642V751_9ASCO|nr:hypothetical protein TRICI_001934 [Trichomonascus ciferrii]
MQQRAIGSPVRNPQPGEEDDDVDLIPRTPRHQKPPRRLYKDTPVPRKEQEMAREVSYEEPQEHEQEEEEEEEEEEAHHEASYDTRIPILPAHEYEAEKEVEDLEEEYSNILSGKSYTYVEEETRGEGDSSLNDESSFRKRMRRPETSTIMEQEEEKNPVLLYVVDPCVGFVKRAGTIGFYTIKFLVSPFLKRRVLSFIFMTIALVLALVLSSVGVYQGLRLGKGLLSRRGGQYEPPRFVPENMDELSGRLMNVEREVESLSRISSSLQAGVRDSSENAKIRLDGLEEELRDVIQGLTHISNDFTVVNKQVDEYSSITDELQASFKDLSSSLSEIQRVVSNQENESSDLRTTIVQHGDAISSSIESIQKASREIETLQTRMTYLERARSGEENVLEILESYLPSRLVVSVDPETKAITAIPEFWSFLDSVLKDKFAAVLDTYEFERRTDNDIPQQEVISWEDFLKFNEQALRSLVQTQINDSWNTHTAVSKEDFQQELQERLALFREDVSDQLEQLDKKVRTAVEYSGTNNDMATGLALENLVRDHIAAYNSRSVLAKPDFASHVNGARVDRPNTSRTYSPHSSRSIFYRMARGLTSLAGFGRVVLNPPEAALNEDTAVGSCWPFDGQSGKLGVLLASEMYPTDLSIEHIPAKVSLNPTTAPRNISLWIHVADGSKRQAVKDILTQPTRQDIPHSYVRVLSSNYNVYSQRGAQVFTIPYAVQKLAGSTSKAIVSIDGNWGNPLYTCLYKVRLYGNSIHDNPLDPQPDFHEEGFGDDELLN